MCWFVDSLVCRLRCYAKRRIFKEFVRLELLLEEVTAFDLFAVRNFVSRNLLLKFPCFCLVHLLYV